MKNILLLTLLFTFNAVAADVAPVSQGQGIFASKINEIITSINQAVSDLLTLKTDVTALKQLKVHARATNSTTAVAGGAYPGTFLVYNNENYDAYNALNHTTGIFKVPAGKAGYYSVTGSVHFYGAAYALGQAIILHGYRNGFHYSSGEVIRIPVPAFTSYLGSTYSDKVYLEENDTFQLRVINDRGLTALAGDAAYTYFSISQE